MLNLKISKIFVVEETDKTPQTALLQFDNRTEVASDLGISVVYGDRYGMRIERPKLTPTNAKDKDYLFVGKVIKAKPLGNPRKVTLKSGYVVDYQDLVFVP